LEHNQHVVFCPEKQGTGCGSGIGANVGKDGQYSDKSIKGNDLLLLSTFKQVDLLI
jgi:hypothetical protein